MGRIEKGSHFLLFLLSFLCEDDQLFLGPSHTKTGDQFAPSGFNREHHSRFPQLRHVPKSSTASPQYLHRYLHAALMFLWHL